MTKEKLTSEEFYDRIRVILLALLGLATVGLAITSEFFANNSHLHHAFTGGAGVCSLALVIIWFLF